MISSAVGGVLFLRLRRRESDVEAVIRRLRPVVVVGGTSTVGAATSVGSNIRFEERSERTVGFGNGAGIGVAWLVGVICGNVCCIASKLLIGSSSAELALFDHCCLDVLVDCCASSDSIRSVSSSLLPSSKAGDGGGFGGGAVAFGFLGTAFGANLEVDLMTEADTEV